ncbi:transferase [Cylindrospermopsis raciborskii CHAB3438]|uniref:LIC12162 family transferase n=1 Tax=Cylindrospermopsis raciborskii TaxID=77022 RepID=UPI001F0FF298|nr:transferase [Cylindrospermopsis raciborskii CHAB3438]
MVKRQLVTTALEATWPTDGQPILFLGEWCKLFDRRHVWESLNHVVAPYHWNDRSKLFQDYTSLQVVYEEALQALAQQLNQQHRVDYSLRYWRIFIGPWLGYFIQMVFDRWFMIKTVIDTEAISNVRVLQRQRGQGVPNDMSDFIAMFVGDHWNEMIYGQILQFMSVPLTVIETPQVYEQLDYNNQTKTTKLRSYLKKSIALIAYLLSSVLTRSDDYFFIASYLVRQQDFLLQLKLGQIPKLWYSSTLPRFDYCDAQRDWLLALPESRIRADWHPFCHLISLLVPQHIPTAYLEGYRNLTEKANELHWPRSPKAIFTSNSYSSDDLFKTWAAEKVENGAPLIIGQHGGNYGMALWSFHESHEIAISDQYLTWGWTEPRQNKLIPVGNLKGFDSPAIKPNKSGKALLVEMVLPRYSYHMYSVPVSAGQWQEYFHDQVRFVKALPDVLRKDLLIRLYSHDWKAGQVSRWQKQFPDMELDLGTRPMKELLHQTRLYISTYNATTYLESLSLNFPTLIFWNPLHWELRDGVQPYFDLLKEAGIFHEAPESAAQQMAIIWDDIDAWWYDPKTQKAREVFCDRYAHIPARPLESLAQLFRGIAEKTGSVKTLTY